MYHLAQLNIGTMQAPLTDPVMAGFVSQLETINALADQTPGFVWRLQDDSGDATTYRPYEDDRIIVNLTVWESIEALSLYVYKSQHGVVMRNRSQWFVRSAEPTFVLWWIEAGRLPTMLEAKAKLDHLRTHGPTPEAFTFKQQFPAPVGSLAIRNE